MRLRRSLSRARSTRTLARSSASPVVASHLPSEQGYGSTFAKETGRMNYGRKTESAVKASPKALSALIDTRKLLYL